MGQQSSTAMPAPAAAAAPNVLARDYTGTTVTVHCVEVCNENVHKLQALLASGADAAELDAALPSERFTGAASSTVADVRAFLQAQQEKKRQQEEACQQSEESAAGAAKTEEHTYLLALRRTPTAEDGSGMVTLGDATQLAELMVNEYCFSENIQEKTASMILLYTSESKYGIDGQQCCLIALCAACCACCIGVCCCCCAAA